MLNFLCIVYIEQLIKKLLKLHNNTLNKQSTDIKDNIFKK